MKNRTGKGDTHISFKVIVMYLALMPLSFSNAWSFIPNKSLSIGFQFEHDPLETAMKPMTAP